MSRVDNILQCVATASRVGRNNHGGAFPPQPIHVGEFPVVLINRDMGSSILSIKSPSMFRDMDAARDFLKHWERPALVMFSEKW